MKLFDHYIPRTDGKLSVWAHTYKQKIGELGASLGLTPEQIPEQQKIAQALIDNIADVAIKRNSFREATSAKKLFQEIHLKEIRRMVRFMKTFGNYSPNMGAELRVVITGQPVNFGDLKPELHPTSLLGKVSVRFIKKRMFGVKLYGRLRGEEEWKYLGMGRRSPFIDKRPLATEEKPEIREYKAMCYDGQREIGLESDMVSVVHAG